MIRTILVLLFLLCFFIISIPLYLIEAIIGHFDIHKKERSSFVIVTTALKIIIWLSGIHLIVKGQEKVPKDQAVLYVSNHRSYFDIVTLYPLTNNTTGFVAKKELKEKIVALTQASCVEMEGAAIAHTAYRNGVPFVILRAISDKADGSAEMAYPEFEASSAVRCAAVVEELCRAGL